MSREKRRLRVSNWVLAVALIAYVAIAVERERVPGREELYPFAAWSLFTLVPNQTNDYSLRIVQVDGTTLERPVYFEQAGEYFRWSGKNSARMSIQKLGWALEKGDAPAAQRERRHVEMMHLGGRQGVRYEVVARRYDAVRRFREGTIDAQRTLATFEIGDATAGGKPEQVTADAKEGGT